jgi:hypothetical protein
MIKIVGVAGLEEVTDTGAVSLLLRAFHIAGDRVPGTHLGRIG